MSIFYNLLIFVREPVKKWKILHFGGGGVVFKMHLKKIQRKFSTVCYRCVACGYIQLTLSLRIIYFQNFEIVKSIKSKDDQQRQ